MMHEPPFTAWQALEYVEMIKSFTQKVGFFSILAVVLTWLFPAICDVMIIELASTLITCTLLSALFIGVHQHYKRQERYIHPGNLEDI